MKIRTYYWDYENRLTKITYPDGSTNTFTYCPLGKRVWKKNKSGTTTFYFYDTDDILAEYDTFGNLQARYTFGRGIDNPISVRIGTQSYFYHLDALGSVISLTDSNKNQVASYSYDVFGFPSPSSLIPNPFLFTSREYDEESGLYYYRARYYDPSVGRFLQVDPILKPQSCPSCPQGDIFSMKGAIVGYSGFNKGMFYTPLILHPYVYVWNNPANLIDPKGLMSREECLNECWAKYMRLYGPFLPGIIVNFPVGAIGYGAGLIGIGYVCNNECKYYNPEPKCPPKEPGFGIRYPEKK